MRSSSDPRHKKRRLSVKELFSYGFKGDSTHSLLTKNVINNLELIDKKIADAAPTWPVEKINKIDHAILRLATYELFFTETPHKVVIDEAVELAKEYGGEASSAFVNGALGAMCNE